MAAETMDPMEGTKWLMLLGLKVTLTMSVWLFLPPPILVAYPTHPSLYWPKIM